VLIPLHCLSHGAVTSQHAAYCVAATKRVSCVGVSIPMDDRRRSEFDRCRRRHWVPLGPGTRRLRALNPHQSCKAFDTLLVCRSGAYFSWKQVRVPGKGMLGMLLRGAEQ